MAARFTASDADSIRAAAGFEAIAVDAVSHVELVTNDGKQHRVRAVEQLAIFDRLKCELGRDVGSAAAVPAKSMSGFRLQPEQRGHWRRVYDRRGST